MKQTFKRITAVVLSAALSLSLVNFSFIGSAFAKETVGYGIDVEYAQDNSSATLVGNTSGLKENIQLEKLVDENGQELDPASFSQTVEENGSYHFTLYYQESVASEDAAANAGAESAVSKTEELEVVVDGIVKPEPQDEVAQNTAAEGATMLSDNGIITAVPTVPLDVLQRSVAESRATSPMTVDIYAYEVEFKLSTAEFSGGELVAGATGLPSVEMRDFYSAVYRPSGSTSEMPISGLYFYNNNWYYTIGENAQETVAGNISVGFLLPTGASVRFYYKVTNTTTQGLTIDGQGSLGAYEVSVNGVPRTEFKSEPYTVGSKVILEFILPPKFQSTSTVTISNPSYTSTFANAAAENTQLVEKTLKKISEFRYALVFTMPDDAVTVTFNGVNWPDGTTYSFGLGTNGAAPTTGEQVVSQSFFYSKDANTNAGLNHLISPAGYAGSYSYWGGQGTLKIITPSGEPKDLTFAVGKYTANKDLTLDLRMDRYHQNANYTWKPSVLRLDVYIAVEFVQSTENFRQYYIPLPTTKGDSTTTEYDFGATVTATCTAMEDRAYQYTITISGMAHNFKIWDNPSSTAQENFFVTNLDGIKVTSGTQEATQASYASYRKDGTTPVNNYALQLYNLYMGKEWKEDGYIDFYVESLYGYTQPTGSLTNNQANASLSEGKFSENGKYLFQLKTTNKGDGNKSPAQLSFTAQPLSLAVKYFYQGNQYADANVTMTASQNSLISFEAKLPDSLTTASGYSLKVYDGPNGTNEIAIIPNPDRENGLWYPNEDIISFSTIYDYMKGKGTLPTTANCVLRIVPENGTGVAEAIQATYEIKTQTGYQALDSNQQTHLEDTNSTTQKGYVSAYVGSTVNLVGYVDQFQTNGKKYKLYTGVSTASGTVQDSATPFATLEYVLATTVTLDAATLGTGSGVTDAKTWNADHANTWYTSVNNLNHLVTDYSTLNAGTRTGMKFAGWGIKKSDGEIVAIDAEKMEYQGNLNLYMIGTANQALWEDIFNSGTCTLVAMWGPDIAWVKSEDGSTIGDLIGDYDTNNPKMIYEGNDTLTITENFSYIDASATKEQLQNMLTNGTLNIALFKRDGKGGIANYSGQWQVKKTYNSGDSNITGPVIGTVTTGNGFVTFSVSFTITSGAVSAQNNGASFKIQAWTSANVAGATVTAQQICDTLNNGTYSSVYAGKIPGVSIYTEVLYKVVNNGSATGTLTVTAGSTGFTLSATDIFKYNFGADYGPDSDDPFTVDMLQQLITEGKIKVSLEKQAKDSSTWEAVSGVDKTALSAGENGAINFTHEITDSNLSAYDGAQFKITLWTDANGSNDRATHTITVTYVSDPTAYVDIPKFIVLEDDQSKVFVGDVKQSGYAGKQVEVKYNQNTMAQANKPSISVAVQDGVKMRLGGVDGTEQENMAIGIYDTSGKKLEPESGYSAVGTLSNTATSLSFWMNVPSGTVKNEQYFATVTFRLELINSVTEFV